MSDLNEILGPEICRTLTEFLGECWHEVDFEHPVPTVVPCIKCNHVFKTSDMMNYRLDFSDPRVVWGLIEKFDDINVWKHSNADLYECYIYHDKRSAGSQDYPLFNAATRQEAVCRAIYAWVKGAKK